MDWKNLELFKMMDREINALVKVNDEPKDDNECKHDIRDVDGLRTCILCGIVERCVYDNDGVQHENKASVRPYEKQKHMIDLLKRISGHLYAEKKDFVDIEKMPQDIKGIRRRIRKKGLHPKNDYYYWRKKNNITKNVSSSDIVDWVNEYRKSRKIKPHDFIHDKFKKIAEYHVFISLFERKKKG